MNVTFLIGNGFDLNLGLKTKYTDFIKSYVKSDKLDSREIEDFKKDLLKDKRNFNLWANAEIEMGRYSVEIAEKYGKRAAEIYCDLHDDFCEKLAIYLKKEQLKIKATEIKDAFLKSVTSVSKGFPLEQANQINSIVKKGEADVYNFIVYNYTTIIDELVADNKKVGEHSYRNSSGAVITFRDYIKEIIHPHGTTTDSMVFGVNDITQIANPQIFDGQPEEYISTFIKKEFNQMVEEGVFEKAQSILNNSGLIYIYGMSLGETDKLWWQQICNLLKQKQNLHVIIHSIDTPSNRLIPRKKITFSKKLKEKLLSYADFTDGENDSQLLKRIHVTGENIFAEIKNVAKDPSPQANNFFASNAKPLDIAN